MFNKKTIKDIDLKGKTVLLRADYNVPIENGVIADDYRIEKSLPTINYLLKQNCKVVIISHLGRPKGPDDKSLSLASVSRKLNKIVDAKVSFINDCIGSKVQKKIKSLKKKEILVLENLRFYKEEKTNDDEFAQRLAENIDVFVQDGFGVVHRSHASTDAITKHLKSVAGLLLENEVKTITSAIKNPDRPLLALVGGSKISDKIHMLNKFIDIADVVAVGGAMANTFLVATGHDVGHSKVDKEEIHYAEEVLDKAKQKAKNGKFVFYLPQDGVVAKEAKKGQKTRIVDWGTHAIAEIESYPKLPAREASLVQEDEMILDIGPFSGAFIAGIMQLSGTVIWNGAMGVTEVDSDHHKIGPFSHGTELVVEGMIGQFGHNPKTIVGGGDTVGYIEEKGLIKLFDHVSTGGGASMELMSGKALPGVEALERIS